ncbi:TSA1-like protein [Cucumis melo var. makuwa]|uniref:TSA1-like protein n=1 Tax=Cucumis melo var. makuwa TaxID=1194695 RepID=A0A5D3DX93_CUCMM|nr:TSA1-like protein [Cucumis melo var. makuwa]
MRKEIESKNKEYEILQSKYEFLRLDNLTHDSMVDQDKIEVDPKGFGKWKKTIEESKEMENVAISIKNNKIEKKKEKACKMQMERNGWKVLGELTLKFSCSAAGLIGDRSPLLGWIRWAWTRSMGITKCQVRDCTTGLWIEAGNVVIHRGLYVSSVTASCSLCAIVCNELFTDRHRYPHVLCIVVVLVGYVVNWNCILICASFGTTRLICASFGITRLICASFGISRLICASFGITRLIGVSFGITRLIGVSFGITRLIGKGTARGRPTRDKKDASRPYGRVWFSLCFR